GRRACPGRRGPGRSWPWPGRRRSPRSTARRPRGGRRTIARGRHRSHSGRPGPRRATGGTARSSWWRRRRPAGATGSLRNRPSGLGRQHAVGFELLDRLFGQVQLGQHLAVVLPPAGGRRGTGGPRPREQPRGGRDSDYTAGAVVDLDQRLPVAAPFGGQELLGG